MSPSRSLLVATTAAFVLTACGGDATNPRPTSGSMSFSYAGGELSGNFATSGIAQWDVLTGEPRFGDYAFGARYGGDAFVMGSQARTSPRADIALLMIEGAATGTYSFEDECEPRCAFGMVMLNVDYFAEDLDDEAVFLLLTEGDLVVTSFTTAEARGTFSGFAVDLETEEEVEITNGSFSVPMMTERQIRGQRNLADLEAAALPARFDAAPLTSVQRVRLQRILAQVR